MRRCSWESGSLDKNELDARLADILSEFYGDALAFVMFAFPWSEDNALQVVDWEAEDVFVDESTGIIYDEEPENVKCVTYKEWMTPYRERFDCRYGPDKWACDWLDEVSREVAKRGFDGVKAVKPIRSTTASGHGIGKSTLVAWVILWIMCTRPFAKGTVTANTAEQLRTKTWAELGKWHKRCISGHWFQYNAGRGNMNLKHKEHGEEWQCTAQTCREENSEAFAGQHAANSTSFYVFDEGSAVPDKIYEVRDGGTVTGEPMVFDFGNPTRNSGRFYEEVEGSLKHRYTHRKIDSRTVYITNKSRIAEWIEDFGIDSDFVKVRVLGEFPSTGSLQFMPTAWVQRAMMREDAPRDRFAAVTIGVDVARFGTDSSVIYPVLGDDARTFAPTQEDGIYQGLDNVQLAQKVADKIEFFRTLGIEVANTYVDIGGMGSGVVDVMRRVLGYECEEVNFGTTPIFEPDVYRYRGDEMWGRCREAIKNKLVLPLLPGLMVADREAMDRKRANAANRLFNDLIQREYGYTLQGEKINLESKRDMKARGLQSPDIADALVLNFANEIARSSVPHGTQREGLVSDHDFDPLANVSVA